MELKQFVHQICKKLCMINLFGPARFLHGRKINHVSFILIFYNSIDDDINIYNRTTQKPDTMKLKLWANIYNISPF